MGAAAEVIKIDADILNLRTKLKQKNRRDLKERMEALLKQRQRLLEQLEAQMRASARSARCE